MSNKHLRKRQVEPNDEWYTLYEDVEKELSNYKKHFKGKVVYCNCDNKNSAFVRYFRRNFHKLKLRKLIRYDGDFRSEESIEALQRSDIIVSNPPFSLIKPYLKQINQHKKKFLTLCNILAVVYHPIFPAIRSNKIRLGVNHGLFYFRTPSGKMAGLGNCCWLTNLKHNKYPPPLHLSKYYHPFDYPKFDNYNAININRTSNIPFDYPGVMGVPVSFITKYNPNQFTIIGLLGSAGHNRFLTGIPYLSKSKPFEPSINNKRLFVRLLIQHKFPV